MSHGGETKRVSYVVHKVIEQHIYCQTERGTSRQSNTAVRLTDSRVRRYSLSSARGRWLK